MIYKSGFGDEVDELWYYSPRLGIQEEKLGYGRVDMLSKCCLPGSREKCPDGSWLNVLKL